MAAERRKLRQAQRERLRANASHSGSFSHHGAPSEGPSDEQVLARLKALRSTLEARGHLEAREEEEEILEGPAVELVVKHPEEDVQVALQAGEVVCLAPNVAQGLLPSGPDLPEPFGLQALVPTETPWQLQASATVPNYSNMWQSLTPEKQPLVAPIETSYQSVLTQTVGPAALDLDAYCSMKDFGREIAENRTAYSAQSREVPLPPGRPDYSRQVARVELPPQNVYGWQAQAQARRQLDEAIAKNAGIREALQKSVARMQRAIPRAYGEAVPARPESAPRSQKGSPRYHKLDLEIEVVKATDLPDAAILATCDPYVIISIVDGNPLHDPEALKGYEEWRALHEQWSGQTRVVEGSCNPEFRARFKATVRPWERTCIHFRLMDQDSIAHADRDIGQAAIAVEELLDDSWAAVRAVALRPVDRKAPGAWAAIAKARLHVAVHWEGVLGKLKNKEKLQRVVQSHAARSKKEGAASFFG